MHDAAALILHLHLFLGVVVAVGGVDEGDDVHGDLVGKGLDHGLLTLGNGGHLLVELVDAVGTGAGDSLIGADDHLLNGGEIVDARDGHEGDDGAAVGVCDNALVIEGVSAVDLRDDQRHVGLKTEGGAVVDVHGAALFDGGGEFPGHVALNRAEDKVQTVEGVLVRLLDGDVLALEGDALADALGAGERTELIDGDVVLGEDLEHFLTNGARSAQNRDIQSFHNFYLQLL